MRQLSLPTHEVINTHHLPTVPALVSKLTNFSLTLLFIFFSQPLFYFSLTLLFLFTKRNTRKTKFPFMFITSEKNTREKVHFANLSLYFGQLLLTPTSYLERGVGFHQSRGVLEETHLLSVMPSDICDVSSELTWEASWEAAH